MATVFTKWWTRATGRTSACTSGDTTITAPDTAVTTSLTNAGVNQVVIDQLDARESTGTSQSVYTKELSLPVLAEAIAKVVCHGSAQIKAGEAW